MNNRLNLFGQGPKSGRGEAPPSQYSRPAAAPPSGYGRPPAPPPRDDTPMAGYGDPRAYGSQPMARPAVGRGQAPPGGTQMRLGLSKIEFDSTLRDQYTFGNLCCVSSQDFPPSRDGTDLYLLLNGMNVVTARPQDQFPPGRISLSDPQRTWLRVGFQDTVTAEIYNPFATSENGYLGAMDVEIAFAGKKEPDTLYDQDVLANYFISIYQNQIFAPGQQFPMNYQNVIFLITIKTVSVADLSMEKPSETRTDPGSRGILTSQCSINFSKGGRGKQPNLKASNKRPAANAIIAPDFKFEDMGIGGLDTEFRTIFRRAFASRIFPPGIIEKLGIQHVKGMLLFGPPGTGKTLIARQIGKMLNAREPKIINGPEVLNKFVGQSEENIRKLFADAEKEYKEKGDESMLHIIIFDELDAVCKQRGSGAGGGTGVGDSVVNQLLSKLDGVDQLNNILLIGMTNRMDMIDDALLRPGRLEVHVEISLPDEAGRAQIIKIHTSKMRENDVIDPDVNTDELAHLTKNFSGAEISGLVKSATSFAFNRHVKPGTAAGVNDNVGEMKVNRDDFMHALDDVKPAFGVSEEELDGAMKRGMYHFSAYVERILTDGQSFVNVVKNSANTSVLSVLLHGPPGSGKTALAAKIAKESEFPFVKLVSSNNMLEMSEAGKIGYLNKVFTDAYKAPLNIIIIDEIERIIEYNSVGPRFHNSVLNAIMVLAKKPPPKNRRLLVIGTTSRRSAMAQIDLIPVFNYELAVPNVNRREELASILDESRAFEEPGVVKGILDDIEQITGSKNIGVGIREVLGAIETAQQRENPAVHFAEDIAQQIAKNSA